MSVKGPTQPFALQRQTGGVQSRAGQTGTFELRRRALQQGATWRLVAERGGGSSRTGMRRSATRARRPQVFDCQDAHEERRLRSGWAAWSLSAVNFHLFSKLTFFSTDLFTNVSLAVRSLCKKFKAKATIYGKERQRRGAQSAFTPHGWRAGVGKASRRGCRSEVVVPRQHWPCQ